MVEALEALVVTESPSADLEACGSFASVADGLAFQIVGRSGERVIADGRTHLRWRFGQQTRVLLVGHLDTVWPIGTAARWPFSVDGDRATGPGIFDMKAGVVQLLFALALVGERRGLDGVTVVLTTDEEIGSPTSRGTSCRGGKRRSGGAHRGAELRRRAEDGAKGRGALSARDPRTRGSRRPEPGTGNQRGSGGRPAGARARRARRALFGHDGHSEPHLRGNSGEYRSGFRRSALRRALRHSRGG